MSGRLWLVAIAALLGACASGESFDGTSSPGGAAGATTGGSGGAAGGGGVPSSGGFPSGGGFPGGAGGVGGVAGSAGGGSGAGGGAGCVPEICNGVDDDCDGTPDNGACSPGCSGKKYLDHGYAYCATAKTLSKAAEDCIAQKMKPARPNDAAENAWLRTTATTLALGTVWLGATDWTSKGTWISARRHDVLDRRRPREWPLRQLGGGPAVRRCGLPANGRDRVLGRGQLRFGAGVHLPRLLVRAAASALAPNPEAERPAEVTRSQVARGAQL